LRTALRAPQPITADNGPPVQDLANGIVIESVCDNPEFSATQKLCAGWR